MHNVVRKQHPTEDFPIILSLQIFMTVNQALNFGGLGTIAGFFPSAILFPFFGGASKILRALFKTSLAP